MYDHIIIGGGILGLATAYRLLEAKPDARLIVLDKEDGVARHQSGHNSGVIHAGVYYKPGSLKAQLCKAGVDATIGFCQRHNVPYEQCGKLIVATDAVEVERLVGLEERVRANGLDYRRVEGDELHELEPNIAGQAALLVTKTGIADFPAMCERMADQITQAGAEISFGAAVTAIRESAAEVVVETTAGAFTGGSLIACAGLQADRVAIMAGLDPDFRTIPFRGEYYKVAERKGPLVRRLIYPVPDPDLPFLGIHLTRMIGGYLTVGPNAVLSFGRETYDGNTLVVRDLRDMARFPGFWKLLARNARAGT
ncbi:MAG: L-2-hydroxyglutarate oxidase, partial [Methyloligellaceae bacterium]